MVEFTNTNVVNNYNQIINELDFVSKLLRKRLAYHNVSDLENKSFDELIDKIEDIQSVTHINKNNKKPLTKPELDFTNISSFNESLFKLIRFYMKKVAYFLVLKGVPPYIVKKAQTLRQLIDLILFIEVISSTHLSVEAPDATYYGNSVLLLAKVIDEYEFIVLKGQIVVKDKETGAILSTAQAGQDVYFTPPKVSDKINGAYKPQTFIIEYHGTEKYLPAESSEVEITVYPTKINLQVSIKNTSPESRYYNSTTTGYHTDTWHISIKTLNYNNTPLKNIPFTMQIGNETIQASTNSSGKYEDDKIINQVGKQLINIATTYANTDELTNSEYQKTVNIKYNIIQQSESTYTDYAGKSYILEATLHNDIDNTITNKYDDNDVIIYIDGVEKSTIHAQNGILTFNINELPYGEHTITWVFYGDNYQTKMKTTMIIVSNFVYNDTNLYYLNDLPEIIYKPLGQISINKKVQAVLKRQYNDTETTKTFNLYTNKNGILHALADYNDIGVYELTLTTKTNNLSETRVFYYEIKKPFTLIQHSYNKKEYVEYDITIFNMEKETSVIVQNNNKTIIPSETILLNENNEKTTLQYKYTADSNSYGTNILTITNNGYTETTSFEFVPKIFTLMTEQVTYGSNSIQIKANRKIDKIFIESDFIDDISINENNNIFTISGIFKKVGNISFNVVDDVNSCETFAIQVVRATINTTEGIIVKQNVIIDNGKERFEPAYDKNNIPYDDMAQNLLLFKIDDILYLNNNNITIKWRIDNREEYTDITNNDIYYYTKKLSDIPSLIPGQHTVTFVFNGNECYQGFTKTIDFTILKKTPNISFNKIDTKMPIYRNDIDNINPIYNAFTINNPDNVDFDFYVGTDKQDYSKSNNVITFLLTKTGKNDFKIITKETDIFNSIIITQKVTGYDYPNEINKIILMLIQQNEYSDDYEIINDINCIINHMESETDDCNNNIKQRTNNIIDKMKEI